LAPESWTGLVIRRCRRAWSDETISEASGSSQPVRLGAYPLSQHKWHARPEMRLGEQRVPADWRADWLTCMCNV
jgi:hypothetical protein